MTAAPPRSAQALLGSPLHLRVTGDRGVTLLAIIWPTLMTARHVSGVAEWHGNAPPSSVVSGQGDESPWGQRFLLVWAAAGPQSVAAVPLLAAAQWRRARLTLPDIDGQPGDTVQVSLNRRTWTATLSATRELNLPAALPIPVELRQLDLGSVLADMASRLLLLRSWLV